MQKLTDTATEQRSELEIQNNRSVDVSFIFKLVSTAVLLYLTSLFFLFSSPSSSASGICDDDQKVADIDSNSTCSTTEQLMATPYFYFSIGFYERVLVALVLTYAPGVESVSFETSIGVLFTIKCLGNMYFILSPYWLYLAIVAVGVASLQSGRRVISQILYYFPVLTLGLFVGFCGLLDHVYFPKLPLLLLRKCMQLLVIPLVGKSTQPTHECPSMDGAGDIDGVKHCANAFFHGSFFRNICLITCDWITLGLVQVVWNFFLLPLTLYFYSFVGIFLKLVGVVIAILMSVNSGLYFFGKSKRCAAYVAILLLILFSYLFLY